MQVEAAFLNGDSIILLGDFNAKLGFDVINHDMNPMSKNGEKLFNLFCKYNLTLLNTLDFCEGTHTRIHRYKSRIEKSILDYVFVSSDLKKNVISMCIDEQKQFTPWRNLKSGKRFPDHCAIKFQLDSKVFVKEKHSKSTQVWNFNDPDGWEKFNKLTNSINMSESMWRASEHTELSYQSWKFNLNSILHRCFKKKKIVSGKCIYNKQIRGLIGQRKKLKAQLSRSVTSTKLSRELEKQISQLDKQIDCQISEFNINIVKSSIGMGGVIDKQSFWKMKKLIAPRSKEIPCSLLDKHDNLLTDPETIRNEYLSEFKHRLRARDIKTELKWYESFQNDICYLRVDAAKSNNSPEFSILELKQVIRELKTGKSMDPTGMVREISKKAGDGFLNSVLDMMNSIKTSKLLPLEWSRTWIITIKKKKGSFEEL